MKMKRPLAWMGFSASAAFLIAGLGGVPVAAALLGTALVAGLLAVCIPRLRALRGLLAVCLAVTAAMGAFIACELLVYRPLEVYAGKTLSLTLQITGSPTVYDRSARYPAQVMQGEVPAGTPVYLWSTGSGFSPQPFDLVSGEVSFFPQEEDAAALRQDKAAGVVLAGTLNTYDGVSVTTPDKKPWRAWLLQMRQAAGKLVGQYLSGDPAEMVRGLCLGDRSGLPDSIEDSFRACGVSHLLVVSGMHLSMVAAALRPLLKKLRLSRRAAAAVTMLAVVAFMLLTGFTPSVKRAGVMMLVLLAGDLFKQEADGINSLGLSLLLMGLANPFTVWDVGLQLSAGSTWGILALYPRMETGFLRPRIRDNPRRWVRLAYRPAQAAAISLAAMVIAPLLMYYFGELSLIFLVANLLMGFPSTVAVVAGLAGVLTGGWCPPLGVVCFGIAGGVSRALQLAADWMSRFPLATVPVQLPLVWVWAALTAAAMWLLWKRVNALEKTAVFFGSVAVLMLGIVVYQTGMRPVTTCTFLEVEEGTAALMEWDGGNALVITGQGDALIRQAAADLSKRNVTAVSVAVFPDLDDEALRDLRLLTDSCEIGMVVGPEQGKYAPAVRSLFAPQRVVLAKGCEINIGEEHRLQWQNGWLRIVAGETRFLFCPDGGDAALLPQGWEQAHVTVSSPRENAGQIQTVVWVGQQSSPGVSFATGREWTETFADAPQLATRGRQDISCT